MTRDGLAPLGLSAALEDQVEEAWNVYGYIFQEDLEYKINEQINEHDITEDGEWLGDWSPTKIVEETLEEFRNNGTVPLLLSGCTDVLPRETWAGR